MKINMTIRIEPELKAQASALFENLGLDLATATRIFYKQALRVHGIPFSIKEDVPNETTRKALADAETGKNMVGPFHSVDDVMRSLDA